MARLETQPTKHLHLLRKSRRVLCGLTQQDVAFLIGKSVFTVHCIERGLREPHPEEARIIARALQCEIADLFPDITKRPKVQA